MAQVVTGLSLVQALAKVGYPIPPNTSDAVIAMPLDGAACLRLEVLLDEDDLVKVARACEVVANKILDFSCGCLIDRRTHAVVAECQPAIKCVRALRTKDERVGKCCICQEFKVCGEISTGDINHPTYRACCDSCFTGLVCP